MSAPPPPTIGVDVGGTKLLGVVLVDGSVVAEDRRATPRGEGPLVDVAIDLVQDLRAKAGTTATAVGLGLPGLVDRQGVLRFAPNLPGVVDLPLAAEVHAAVGIPVRVDNDVTCATWAERQLGAAAGADDCVLVALGTGIGGGLIADGQLVRGTSGFAGEIGHMVVDPGGPVCPCGRRGCWERFASGSGLGRLGREAVYAGRADRILALAGGDPEEVRGEHVTTAAVEGDPDASAVVEQFAEWLALGLVNLTNVLDPALIVIGGGLVAAGELVLGPTREAFDRHLVAPRRRPIVPIVPAALGEHAGAVGAALLAAAGESSGAVEARS